MTLLVFWLCYKSAVNDIRNGKADIVTTQKYLTEQRKRNQIMSKQARQKLRRLQRSVRKPRLQIGRVLYFTNIMREKKTLFFLYN